MLKIRFSLRGKKGQPTYDILVQEKSAAVKGKFVEKLGFYHPAIAEKPFELKMDRVEHWLSKGAQPSGSAASLLKKAGLKGMEKFMTAPTKKRPVKNPTEAPAPAPAPVAEAPAAEEAPAEEAA